MLKKTSLGYNQYRVRITDDK